jgi:RNA polymerase sigma-70 factor (sigma-E family)
MTAMIEEAVAEARRVEPFEDFFHANYERLLRAMYLATGNRHEAEDLAQDAMARVLERWDRLSSQDPLGYVFRVALNRRRSLLRRIAIAIRKTPSIGADQLTEPMSAVDDRDAIRRALDSLPDGQREAIVLVEWLEMTDVQSAEVLGISPGAVRTRASRARAALREVLQEGTDV